MFTSVFYWNRWSLCWNSTVSSVIYVTATYVRRWVVAGQIRAVGVGWGGVGRSAINDQDQFWLHVKGQKIPIVCVLYPKLNTNKTSFSRWLWKMVQRLIWSSLTNHHTSINTYFLLIAGWLIDWLTDFNEFDWLIFSILFYRRSDACTRTHLFAKWIGACGAAFLVSCPE